MSLKGSFPMSKVLVFEGNSYVPVEKMKILDNFMIFHMVKNVIKGSFPISKF